MLKIFYSQKENAYFCNEEIKCTNCDGDINEYMLLVSFWDKRNSCVSHFCRHCFKQFKASSLVTEHKVVILDKLPEDAFPVVIRPPELTNGNNLTVFQAADLTLNTEAPEKIMDKTLFSGRDSWEGCGIGNLEYKESQDKILPYPDIQIERELRRIQNAKPIIPMQIERD